MILINGLGLTAFSRNMILSTECQPKVKPGVAGVGMVFDQGNVAMGLNHKSSNGVS